MSLLLFTLTTPAQEATTFVAQRLKHDQNLNTDPTSRLWREAPAVFFESGPHGEAVARHRSEVQARWTPQALYFLFTCPYESLYLKPSPDQVRETNKLWDYDVAEVFIGADFSQIWRYREFEVSPQNEWIDLDIDSRHLDADQQMLWNSGFAHAARIDAAKKVWYAAMSIPMQSISSKPVAKGTEFRLNFFRMQGPPPDRKALCWQASGKETFHVPEAFGRLRLGE
ncbi:MAG: carbohydrate-binding family 9-like protein [Bryobacteraceae bacterium]